MLLLTVGFFLRFRASLASALGKWNLDLSSTLETVSSRLWGIFNLEFWANNVKDNERVS